MNISKSLVVIAMFLPGIMSVNGSPLDKPGPESDFRSRWSSVRSDGAALYDVVTIVDATEDQARREALVRDAKGEQWVLQNVHDFARQVISAEIRHIPTGEYVRLSFEVPTEARTRREALSELKRRPGSATENPIVTLQTKGLSRSAAESEWRNLELTADLRTEVRTSLSTFFLDSLERMKETLLRHDPNFASIENVARLLSHSSECDATNRYSKRVERWPDCDFDKEFGRPCSEAREERVEAAFKKGVQLHRY